VHFFVCRHPITEETEERPQRVLLSSLRELIHFHRLQRNALLKRSVTDTMRYYFWIFRIYLEEL